MNSDIVGGFDPDRALHAEGVLDGPSPLRIRLLGGFSFSCGIHRIDAANWPRRKAGQLVKILACHPERRLHRDQLFDYLWPDLDPDAAANNFRVTLHSVRQTSQNRLGVSDLIVMQDELVGLADQERLSIDAREFEASGTIALSGANRLLYQQAIALYAGELLPEDRFEEWSLRLRASVQEMYVKLLDGLAGLHERDGDLDSARSLLRDGLAIEPLREQSHAALMRVEAKAGRRAAAIRQFQELSRLLEEEVDAEPDPFTQTLYEEILAGSIPGVPAGQVDNPVLDVPDTGSVLPDQPTLHNLPVAMTRFVGRKRESIELQHLVKQARQVTVTGPGGGGKTRLCLDVAKRVVNDFPDGVWLVELESIADPDLVIRALAAALRIREDPWESLCDRLIQHLRGRRMLLLFDNCEHLVPAVATLIDRILRRCPDIRVLATSREVLGVPGERVWRLPPMTFPHAGTNPDAQSLRRNDAVELFVERAGERVPGYSLTDDEVRTVADICRVLEGIPLSITLAAAWTPMLPVAEIAGRLDSALSFLTTGARTDPARHQTLRATLHWSYNLLNEPEQALLRRIGVFRGGFSLEAVEFVCAEGGDSGGQVAGLLSQLIDKSLVLVEQHGNTARYRALEAVREYAYDRLTQSGELAVVRARYRDWYLDLAEQAEPGLVGGESREWMARLTPEIHNLRGVMRWSLERGDRTTLLRIAGSLWGFWLLSGRLGEGRSWIEPAFQDRSIETAPELVQVRALHAAGFLAQRQGDYRQAIDWTEACLRRSRAIGDDRGTNYALNNLCLCSLYRGDIDRTIQLATESLALSRVTGIKPVAPSSLSSIGLAEYWRGNLDEAWQYLQAAVNAARDIGFPEFESWLLGQLADVARARGSSDDARNCANQAIDLGQSVDDDYGPALGHRVHGRLAAETGEIDKALHLITLSLTIFQSLGYKLRMIECLEDLAELAASLEDTIRAVRLLSATEQLRSEEGCPPPLMQRRTIDQIMNQAQSSMSAASFDAATTIGRTLMLEEAVRDALTRE